MNWDIIPKLKEDEYYPSMLSADFVNTHIIGRLNALSRITVNGGKITYSDSNIVMDVSGSAGNNTPSTPSSGSTFISSSIYCIAKWA